MRGQVSRGAKLRASHTIMAAKFFVFALLVATVRASGGYSSFSYGVSDPNTGDVKDQHEKRVGNSVVGKYSLLESDGTKRIVEYAANSASGFNAVVRKEPVVGLPGAFAGAAHGALATHPAQIAPIAPLGNVASSSPFGHGPITPVGHGVAPFAPGSPLTGYPGALSHTAALAHGPSSSGKAAQLAQAANAAHIAQAANAHLANVASAQLNKAKNAELAHAANAAHLAQAADAAQRAHAANTAAQIAQAQADKAAHVAQAANAAHAAQAANAAQAVQVAQVAEAEKVAHTAQAANAAHLAQAAQAGWVGPQGFAGNAGLVGSHGALAGPLGLGNPHGALAAPIGLAGPHGASASPIGLGTHSGIAGLNVGLTGIGYNAHNAPVVSSYSNSILHNAPRPFGYSGLPQAGFPHHGGLVSSFGNGAYSNTGLEHLGHNAPLGW